MAEARIVTERQIEGVLDYIDGQLHYHRTQSGEADKQLHLGMATGASLALKTLGIDPPPGHPSWVAAVEAGIKIPPEADAPLDDDAAFDEEAAFDDEPRGAGTGAAIGTAPAPRSPFLKRRGDKDETEAGPTPHHGGPWMPWG